MLKPLVPFVVASVVFLILRGEVLKQFSDETPTLKTEERPLELMNDPFLKLVDNQYVPFDFPKN
ncbi:MAG: hypothetical protein HC817_16440 [Saprospiraceae bacterium]|nr:hypothetical protein [Saprospiraceae bacterium]